MKAFKAAVFSLFSGNIRFVLNVATVMALWHTVLRISRQKLWFTSPQMVLLVTTGAFIKMENCCAAPLDWSCRKELQPPPIFALLFCHYARRVLQMSSPTHLTFNKVTDTLWKEYTSLFAIRQLKLFNNSSNRQQLLPSFCITIYHFPDRSWCYCASYLHKK